jgi:hypothetical protein
MIAAYLPFDASTAQRLMKVARDERIAKAAHGQLLPDSWRTAYELTKLPSPAFEAAVTSHEINPRMTRADAVRLVKEAVPPKPKKAAKKDEEEPTAAAEDEAAHRWRNSVAVHAKDAIGLSEMWARTYGKWKRFEVNQDLRDTVRKAADEWDSILKAINAQLEKQLQKPQEDSPKPMTGAERTRKWREGKKAAGEAEGAKP